MKIFWIVCCFWNDVVASAHITYVTVLPFIIATWFTKYSFRFSFDETSLPISYVFVSAHLLKMKIFSAQSRIWQFVLQLKTVENLSLLKCKSFSKDKILLLRCRFACAENWQGREEFFGAIRPRKPLLCWMALFARNGVLSLNRCCGLCKVYTRLNARTVSLFDCLLSAWEFVL